MTSMVKTGSMLKSLKKQNSIKGNLLGHEVHSLLEDNLIVIFLIFLNPCLDGKVVNRVVGDK